MVQKPPEINEIIITKLTRIETVLLGVPDTEDRGLCGDVKCIRRETAEQASQIADHGEAIARIVARCEERTECAPKKQWKKGGKFTALIGAISGLVYGLVELLKR